MLVFQFHLGILDVLLQLGRGAFLGVELLFALEIAAAFFCLNDAFLGLLDGFFGLLQCAGASIFEVFFTRIGIEQRGVLAAFFARLLLLLLFALLFGIHGRLLLRGEDQILTDYTALGGKLLSALAKALGRRCLGDVGLALAVDAAIDLLCRLGANVSHGHQRKQHCENSAKHDE